MQINLDSPDKPSYTFFEDRLLDYDLLKRENVILK